MSLLTMMTPQQTRKINWASATGLWNIAQLKLTGLTMVDIFLIQAFDNDLKALLKHGKEKLIIPHLERIQKFMQDEGIGTPSVPNRKNLQKVQDQLEPNSVITDNEIAIDIHNIMKEGLKYDLLATLDASRPDISKFAWDILNEDYKAFENATQLFVKKNWIQTPPTL